MEMKLEKLLVCIYVYIYQCFTVTIVIYVIYKFALSLIKYQRHLKKILSMQRIYYYIRD